MPANSKLRHMVKIGTPLTKVAKKALLCGSGELGKEVAIELQRYGVEVIALDRYENAPAMQVAHRSYVLSMLDGAKLREIIEKEQPDIIIPEVEVCNYIGVDHGNDTVPAFDQGIVILIV